MDLKMSDFMKMQHELWEKNKEKWEPLTPEYARNSLLWMMEEVGEVISVIMKKKETEIMDNPKVRDEFVTETTDVMMYFVDMLLRLGITENEFCEAYAKKHARNMGRDFEKEYKKLYS